MEKSSNRISVSQARQLQENWLATRATDIEKGRGFADACEFVFSVAELQDFLDYIKSQSETTNPGIRIYFAAYDNDHSDKATVFLAPTMGASAESENNYSLEALNKGISGWPPKNY